MRKGKQYMDDLKENMNDIASAYNEEQEEFREPVVSENGSVK